MDATLKFLYGPMGATKSLQLMTTAFKLDENNIPSLTIKPSIDTRDGDGLIYSRVGISRKCLMVDSDTDLYELVEKLMMEDGTFFKCVFVDECQFLTEKQVEQLSDVVDKLGVSVYCYGLRTDFRTRLFPGSKRLFELADVIEEIPSTCKCGNLATVNARMGKDGTLITSGPQTLVGGDDRYTSLCRRCWKVMSVGD